MHRSSFLKALVAGTGLAVIAPSVVAATSLPIYTDEQTPQTFSDLPSAVAALGSNPMCLVISAPQTLVASLSLPSNIELRFVGAGQIIVPNGSTLTINGPIQAGLTQIFSGVVSISSLRATEIWVEWFGAVGDATQNQGSGTDSTVAIQAAINAVPAFGGIDVRFAGGKYRITSSLNIIDTSTFGYKANLRLIGKASRQAGDTNVASWLIWDSPDSTSPLLNLHSRECHVEGFTFTVANGRILNVGIDIDQDATHTTGTSYIVTQNRIRDCHFTSNASNGKTGILNDGIRVAWTTNSNCEFMAFEYCQFDYLTHAGVFFASGGWQSKNNMFSECSFARSPYGVYANTASLHFYSCNFDHLTCGVYVASGNDYFCAENCMSETCSQLFRIGLNGEPVTIIGGRFALDGIPATVPAGSEYIYATRSSLSLIGVQFDTVGNYQNFKIANGGNSSITAIGCGFPIASPFVTSGQSTLAIVGCILQQSYPLPTQYITESGAAPAPFTLTAPLAIAGLAAKPFALNSLPAYDPTFTSSSPTGGSLAQGIQYKWNVSYVTDAGETLLSHGINPQTAGTRNGPATATATFVIPQGPAGTVARKLWRSDWTTYWLVGTVQGNAPANLTDTGSMTVVVPPTSDTSNLATFGLGAFQTHVPTSQTATTGSAVIPANAAGFIELTVKGQTVKVPYFNS